MLMSNNTTPQPRVKFDWRFYIEYHTDLGAKGITTEEQARNHYIKYGRQEGRIPHPERLSPEKMEAWRRIKISRLLEQVPPDFNARNYLLINNDIYKSGVKTEQAAKLHYVKYGRGEKRVYSNAEYPLPNLPPIQEQQGQPTSSLPTTGPKINILMRNTYRPTYFRKCIQSILTQKYQDYRIIMCYDDDNCLEYLKEYMDHEKMEIFKATSVDKSQSHFYNLYCNELLSRVKSTNDGDNGDGWIMFLDDDDMFESPDSLSILASNISRETQTHSPDITRNNRIFLWKVRFSKNILVYPRDKAMIKKRDITTCGLCFHSKYKDLSQWESKQGSDWIYFSKLFENVYGSPTVQRIFIDRVLTRTTHNNIGQNGIKDHIPLDRYIQLNGIKYLYVSPSLSHLKSRFLKMYNLADYVGAPKERTLTPTVFFGLYRPEDSAALLGHSIANRHLMLGGSDVANVAKLSRINDNISYIAISKNIQERLFAPTLNISSTYVEFNLVDRTLFKPVSRESGEPTIFIYNGLYKKPDNSVIYNQELIDRVVQTLSQKDKAIKYIYSSELNAPYESMPGIYSRCFIGLRLTGTDGNANMVQEMEAMNIPVIHNHSQYGLKWTGLEDILRHIETYRPVVSKQENKDTDANTKSNVLNINAYKCINIENTKTYLDLINDLNGDNINETNFIRNIQKLNITLYFNNEFISGNKNIKPEITISRNKNYNQLINKNNVFLSSIPYRKETEGLYCITQSMIDAIKDKNSLLYPHVYDTSLYDELNNKPFFFNEQVIDKNWYNWATDKEIKDLRDKHFTEDAFIICICGRIAINSYPKSLLEAIKILRGQGHNIQLLALTKFEVRPERLTQNLYDEITSYEWVKSFTVDKKDVLNYFRICDILASTYRDYCNHVGGSNKIKEYLLCNKPILCSRGKERESELGENYFGFYECETCNTVPPLCWTQEYLKNPNCYTKQCDKYFNDVNIDNQVENILKIINTVLKKELIITITTYKRNNFIKNYILQLSKQIYSFNYHIIIVDDDLNSNLEFSYKNIYYYKNNRNYGNKEYYKNFAKNIKNIAFFTDKYIFSCDDIHVDTNFLSTSIKFWNEINDKNKIVLTLYNDRDLSWTNKCNEYYNENVLKSYWQETLFLCNNKFINEYINLDKNFTKPKNLMSSGVPRFFSINNLRKNYSMYVIKNNIINNLGMYDSKMNNYEQDQRIIRKYNSNKIRLLIITSENGLHFMNTYIDYIQKLSYIELNIDDSYQYVSNKNSMKRFNEANYSSKLQKLLDDFDPHIIFCEWGNYLLYELSHRKKPHQKLICRLHRFDIYLQIEVKNIWKVKWENVDLIICVADYFKDLMIKNFTCYKNIITINNYFNFNMNNDVTLTNKNFFNIGIIGIERQVKRLDLAILILNKLKQINMNFKLFSKGYNCLDENILKITNTMDKTNYYHELHSDKNNISVNQWIINNNISHIISVSDNESFHYSIISAIENNCNYYITNWNEIAKTLWRDENIYNNVDNIVKGLIEYNNLSETNKINHLTKNKQQCINNYTINNVDLFSSIITSF